jgi:hypothetical protein
MTKRDIYINHVCNNLRGSINDLQDSFYEQGNSHTINILNQIISDSHTVLNQTIEE